MRQAKTIRYVILVDGNVHHCRGLRRVKSLIKSVRHAYVIVDREIRQPGVLHLNRIYRNSPQFPLDLIGVHRQGAMLPNQGL